VEGRDVLCSITTINTERMGRMPHQEDLWLWMELGHGFDLKYKSEHRYDPSCSTDQTRS